MTKLVIALVILASFVGHADAANHYVRSGASGDGSGSDWTNACTDFIGSCAVASLVRGDTYYVATGTYASLVLTTAESGSLVIRIQGATASDHGTDTGWSSSFGVDVTQATFNSALNVGVYSNIYIRTSYWDIDGMVGSGSSPSSYGFLLAKPSPCSSAPQHYLQVSHNGTTSTTQTSVTVRHIAVVGCGESFDVSQQAVQIGGSQKHVTDSIFGNSYLDATTQIWAVTNGARCTFEYNYVNTQWSSASNHGEVMLINNCHNSDGGACTGATTACEQGLCTINNTFRYNFIGMCDGTGCIMAKDLGNANAAPGMKIYGNVFKGNVGGNNGVLGSGATASHYIQDWAIYNNTFIDQLGTIVRVCGSTCTGATGNVFKNNLLYNSSSALVLSAGSLENDYNSYLSAIDTPPTETNGQIATLNPFVSSASGNYALVDGSSVSAGLELSSPYTTDPNGISRGADGVWDRGAYEFVNAGSTGGMDLAKVRPGKRKGKDVRMVAR